jgi:hypothetical protein
MAHVRKQIRDNIVTTLTGLATTGSRVYKTRVYPLAQSKLPGLAIYTETEDIEIRTINPPRTQMRNLTVTVDAFVKGVSNFDDDLDTICQEVEEALAADITRGGLAKDTRITGFEAEFSGDGDQPVANGRISVTVDYVTLENAVDSAA